MKLRDFRDLCLNEWRDNSGDVAVLWLTHESYKELQDDASDVFDQQAVMLRSEMGIQDSGIRMNSIMNPATRNPVRLKLARDMDVADVLVGNHIETRYLEPDTALDIQYRSRWGGDSSDLEA